MSEPYPPDDTFPCPHCGARTPYQHKMERLRTALAKICEVDPDKPTAWRHDRNECAEIASTVIETEVKIEFVTKTKPMRQTMADAVCHGWQRGDECVVLMRTPNGRIVCMTDGDNNNEMAVFANMNDARLAIETCGNPIIEAGCQYQIVKCDKLWG